MQKFNLALLQVCIIAISFSCNKTNSNTTDPITPTTPGPVIPQSWTFEGTPSWTDEFETNGIPDPLKWDYETGGSGWGNNELQYYTRGENVKQENGQLVITAKKEDYNGKNYTSTRLVTNKKAEWLYGRIEIKARLPKGRGTWPALWMFPSESFYGTWPKSGEIDIMEHVGYDMNNVHFSLHTEVFNFTIQTEKTAKKYTEAVADSFHVYRLDWTPYGIRGFIDGIQYFEFINNYSGYKTWPFDRKFFLIMNIAVGGNWGGAQGIDNNAFPATLNIDYVRYYKFLQ